MFVEVDGTFVELDRERPPTIVDGLESSVDWQVACAGGVATLGLAAGAPEMTIGLPPRRDGVVYLVSDDVLLRLADRDDLVCAQYFSVELPESDELFVVLRTVRRVLEPVTDDTKQVDVVGPIPDVPAARGAT